MDYLDDNDNTAAKHGVGGDYEDNCDNNYSNNNIIYLFICLFVYLSILFNDTSNTSNTFSLMVIDTSYDKVTTTRNGLILSGHE